MDAPLAPMFAVWLPALQAGTLSVQELVAWADERIIESTTPPLWLAELCLATDLDGVMRAASAVPEPVRSYGLPELYLGFMYLEFENGKLPLHELLLRAGQFADRGESGPLPECEAFYYLLNEIDGGGPTRPSDRPLVDRVRDLFAPMATKAREAMRCTPKGRAAR